ncbi:uncharacterized protein LOC144627805 [Crassostrea virginica]
MPQSFELYFLLLGYLFSTTAARQCRGCDECLQECTTVLRTTPCPSITPSSSTTSSSTTTQNLSNATCSCPTTGRTEGITVSGSTTYPSTPSPSTTQSSTTTQNLSNATCSFSTTGRTEGIVNRKVREQCTNCCCVRTFKLIFTSGFVRILHENNEITGDVLIV